MLLPLPADEPRLANHLTPMIDIIFQLLIFFMCATKFRLLEGKLASYLPNRGTPVVVDPQITEEFRILVRYDEDSGATSMYIGERELRDASDIVRYVAEPYRDFHRLGRRVAVMMDADNAVPVRHVVWLLNACVRAGIPAVEFVDRGN
jgi:biopolymer transport protein ExbD